MQVIFCSDMFSDVENDIKNSRHPNPVSGHKFQEHLLRGLLQNNINLQVLNISSIRRYPDYKQIIFRNRKFFFDKQCVGLDLAFINIFALNYLTKTISVYRHLLSMVSANTKESIIILLWNSNIQTLLPALWVKRKFNHVALCNAVGDISGKFGVATFSRNIKGMLLKRVAQWQDALSRKCDCFVYLTKYIKSALRTEGKPCCILEAMYSVNASKCSAPQCDDHITIFYAGSLNPKYGIEHLLRAFSLINDARIHLRIAGAAHISINLIEEYCKQDNRISYMGMLPPSEVAKYQAQATVLVSPRKSTEPFVKYSFPSKTVECLAGGTPYVAHRLPCEPPEYADYIQYPDDESDEALARKLEEICNLPEAERRRIGERGREFIAREKNPKVMCKRIVDMWRGMLGE